MSLEKVGCKNCGAAVEGNFCSQCGQKKQDRVTIKTILSDTYNAAIDFESPFIKSMITLTINPGKLYREYLDGARQRYFSPIRYSLWVMTIAIAIAGFAGAKLLPEFQTGAEDQESAKVLETYNTLLNAIIIPINFLYAAWMSIFARLAFRKEKYSQSELFIPMLLNGAQLYLLWLPIVILGNAYNPIQYTIYFLVSVAYMAWGLAEMYQPRTWKNYLKSIGMVLLGQFTFSLLIGILSIGGMFAVGLYLGYRS